VDGPAPASEWQPPATRAQQVAQALAYIDTGDWVDEASRGTGPMSVAYDSNADRIDVHLPSAAVSAGQQLEARYPGLIVVTLDDGKGRC
jgi:hypothetical protein